jgi:hypothetical protein
LIHFVCADARTKLDGACRILFPLYLAEELSIVIFPLASSLHSLIFRQAAYGIHHN